MPVKNAGSSHMFVSLSHVPTARAPRTMIILTAKEGERAASIYTTRT